MGEERETYIIIITYNSYIYMYIHTYIDSFNLS